MLVLRSPARIFPRRCADALRRAVRSHADCALSGNRLASACKPSVGGSSSAVKGVRSEGAATVAIRVTEAIAKTSPLIRRKRRVRGAGFAVFDQQNGHWHYHTRPPSEGDVQVFAFRMKNKDAASTRFLNRIKKSTGKNKSFFLGVARLRNLAGGV